MYIINFKGTEKKTDPGRGRTRRPAPPPGIQAELRSGAGCVSQLLAWTFLRESAQLVDNDVYIYVCIYVYIYYIYVYKGAPFSIFFFQPKVMT